MIRLEFKTQTLNEVGSKNHIMRVRNPEWFLVTATEKKTKKKKEKKRRAVSHESHGLGCLYFCLGACV